MREITDHKVDAVNKTIDIRHTERGYKIIYKDFSGEYINLRIPFHEGPVCEGGVTGITNEVLLAILYDHIESEMERLNKNFDGLYRSALINLSATGSCLDKIRNR